MNGLRILLSSSKEYDSQSKFSSISVALTGLYFLSLWPQNAGLKHLDSYEFLAQAEQLGICHPPGYSLFSSLGHIFILIGSELGFSSAWSLLSGLYVLGLITLLSLSWVVWKSSGSLLVSLFFGISLLQCRVFQFASNTIEVYGLLAFLFTLFLISIQWQQIPWCKYLLGGLLISHHTTAGPVVLFFLFFHRQMRLNCLKWSFLLFLGPFVHCAYLTFRASSPLNYWFDFADPREHFYHFSAKLYSVFLGMPNVSSLDRNLKAIIENFPLWCWLLISIILLTGALRVFNKSLVDRSNTNLSSVGWIPSLWILIAALTFELVRNLCYHISDIYSHTILFSILLLLIVVKILEKLSYQLRLFCSISSLLGILLLPKIYDRVDEVVDLQKLVLQDAKILSYKTSDSVFISNAVTMFPMFRFASKYSEIAPRLIPDWSFVEKGFYERVRRRSAEAKLGLTFNPFPKVESEKYFFFKQFLHLNKYYPSGLYLAALYASEPMLGSGNLDLNYINRGMWNQVTESSPEFGNNNPVLLVVSGYVDHFERFQFTRLFRGNQVPVITLYLKNPLKSHFLMQVEWGSESSIEKVTFLDQPTHFHLKQFSEDIRGSATIRFFDLQKRQLFSEFQIEKHL